MTLFGHTLLEPGAFFGPRLPGHTLWPSNAYSVRFVPIRSIPVRQSGLSPRAQARDRNSFTARLRGSDRLSRSKQDPRICTKRTEPLFERAKGVANESCTTRDSERTREDFCYNAARWCAMNREAWRSAQKSG